MKGRLYKPFSRDEIAIKEEMPRPRPWLMSQDEPVVYMWRTSIPDKWVKIKGKTAFQHVSETNKNKSTLDFLRTNQKYIRAIADTRAKSPQNVESHITSRAPSQATSRIHSPRSPMPEISSMSQFLNDSAIPKQNPLGSSYNSPLLKLNYPEIKIEEFKKSIPYSIPIIEQKLIASASMKSFTFDGPETKPDNYIVNKYSLPKVLITMKKKSENQPSFKNHTVNEFLRRFHKRSDSMNRAVQRRVPNGWKLVNFKKNLK